MPITLPPISRRRFVGGVLGAGVAVVLPTWARAAGLAGDSHHFAFLSDIHVDKDRTFAKEGANPWDNLQQAIGEILGLEKRPAAVLINGDCAAHKGYPEDYATLIDGLAPLRKAGMPIHLSMGNHDERENFWAALPPDTARQKDVPARQVCVIEAARVNFIMLDSLRETMKTPGILGAGQLAWLAKALDARKDKPAIVMVHHDPLTETKPQPGAKPVEPSGLLDTKAFYEVIVPRKQVKAYVYGHTHEWHYEKHEGIHLVNLPTTAWLFKEGPARGWVDLNLAEDGGTFELRSLDVKHRQHGEKLELKWR